MRRIFYLLLGFPAAAMLLAACGADLSEGPPPLDFQLRYDWREGSLPPPYHYEYSIVLNPNGSGMIAMVPDYPGPGVPVWEEPFSLTPNERDQLHDELISQGLVRERWREQSSPPVGGSFATLTVIRDGRTIELPAFPIEEQRAQAEAIFSAVEAIVPQAIRDDLQRKRAEYEAQQLDS
jgi:hypothetical protein